MDLDKSSESLEQTKQEDEDDWLLDRKDTPEPMDTNVSLSSQCDEAVDKGWGTVFTRERVFDAASDGDVTQLNGLLEYLQNNNKRLTSPEFIDEKNGKTALLKALLNLKNGKNDTIEVFLDIAENTGDLNGLINAAYTDTYYKGQTALHVAIERRSFDYVRLLVQKGANVQAKANGKFFKYDTGMGFYFGELPFSLAACTNQLNIMSFLMETADLSDTDSQGNTVLHALVVLADNTPENTEIIAKTYDEILIQHHKREEKTGGKKVELETIKNDQGLTPLKLAAKLGKIWLFKHMLQREFVDEDTKLLSRKFTEWVYGPVHSSLYDTTSLDTDEENSVLDIIVFGSEIPRRYEMLQIEPLRSLLEDKWDRFASKLFLMTFIFYVIYLGIFTAVAFYRKEGKPPFPVEKFPRDYIRCAGEIISVLGGVYFFIKTIIIFKRNPPNLKALYVDGFSEILFFLQATLLLICAILYISGRKEYVGPLVLSLAVAWINILHYTRGSKQLGIYNVMMQRMILSDILHFLFVYAVFLFGFSAAVVSLTMDTPPEVVNITETKDVLSCDKPTYNDFRYTILEMFKFTIGMGDLQFNDHVLYKEVFYIILILYIALTYILLLNMLIALMGNTVETLSRKTENIWKLQRAITILDMESSLPWALRSKLYSGVEKTLSGDREHGVRRRFFRVEETNWSKWRSDLGVAQEEGPGDDIIESRPRHRIRRVTRNLWALHPALERIHARHRQPHQGSVV